MKIDTLLISHQDRAHTPASMQQDFKHWLNEHPKQQDNYYWTHLSELQVSALQFDPIEETGTAQAFFASKEPQEKKLPVHEEIKPSLSPVVSIVKQSSDNARQQPTVCVNELPALSTSSISIEAVSYITESSKIKEATLIQKKAWDSIEPPMPLEETQNFQLFTQGKQVELALNTQHLPAQETKNLINSLKLFFKKKGLLLKKLLLNGVAHDTTH